jgi:putative MFS transporter
MTPDDSGRDDVREGGAPARGATTLLEAIDDSPLTPRYWGVVGTVMVCTMLEFFDFFLISFIVAIVAEEWKLTFGQVAIVLLAAGVGGIFGSFLAGAWGDKIGRRPLMMIGIVAFSAGTGLAALAPDGGWWFLSGFRFVVGAAVGALLTATVPLVVELTPTRLRSSVSGFGTVGLIPLGTLMAALLASTLGPVIGWRGLLLIGALPILLVPVVAKLVPESPRWLIGRGRMEEARENVAWVLNRDPQTLAVEEPPAQEHAGASYRVLYGYTRTFWGTVLAWFGATVSFYGATLWGPTVIALLLDLEPEGAARLFLLVVLAGLAGRVVFSFLPQAIGRRKAGVLAGLGAFVLMALAGILHNAMLGGFSAFIVFLMAASVFYDGGFANLTPQSAEVFPGQLRSHGLGLAQAVNAGGKIMGPLGLALIAGTGNFVTPEATEAAITPGFIYLGAGGLLVLVGYLLLPETHGKTLESVVSEVARRDRETPAAAQPAR